MKAHTAFAAAARLGMMRAFAPFFAFAPALRATRVPAAPEQVQSSIAAVGLPGPCNVHDIRRAAHAVFGPGPERRKVFDAVFPGRIFAAPGKGASEDLPDTSNSIKTRRCRGRLCRVGSMKAGTDGALRLAHALVQAGERVEVFTPGTRLTRVTRAQPLQPGSGADAGWGVGGRLGWWRNCRASAPSSIATTPPVSPGWSP